MRPEPLKGKMIKEEYIDFGYEGGITTPDYYLPKDIKSAIKHFKKSYLKILNSWDYNEPCEISEEELDKLIYNSFEDVMVNKK